MVTDADMRQQVTEVLEAHADQFDIDAIVDHIQKYRGRMNIADVPDWFFWEAVRVHPKFDVGDVVRYLGVLWNVEQVYPTGTVQIWRTKSFEGRVAMVVHPMDVLLYTKR